jgi:predicted nucleotidyltransferase
MYSHEKKVLARIASTLRDRFGQKIASVYAFGSRARGSHGEQSDFDVLIVVKGKEPEIEHAIMEAFVEEELNTGLIFAPIVKDEKAFDLERQYHSPFYENIQREGISL